MRMTERTCHRYEFREQSLLYSATIRMSLTLIVAAHLLSAD